jgi:cobalt-zinc-cadmium resistance protein CzcA
MIQWIIRLSLHHRVKISLLGLLLIVGGLYNLYLLPLDALPDITNKQVQVNAVAGALNPEEMERRVTFPLELGLAGIPHLVMTRSISQFGLSQITLIFQENIDIYFARQQISERLQQVRDTLPQGVRVEMSPVSSGLGEIYYAKLENKNLSAMEKRTLMDWVVRPQLRTVEGLADVNTFGGLVRQYQVQADPQKLQSLDLTFHDLAEALEKNNANGGGAYIEKGQEQQLVRSVGMLDNPLDIRNIVLGQRNGVPIRVADVATIEEGGMVRQGAITENGKGEQVYVIALLLMGENGRVVVQRVKDKLLQVEKALPPGSHLTGFLDRSQLIERTLATAGRNLLEGGAVVILLLFLFLLQLRAGLIASSAIPLAMLFAVIGMRYFQVSASLMSLGAIDFGIIVDGSVIIVENCVRRLAEERHRLGRDLTEPERIDLIEHGSAEVRQATQFGELIIMVSYLPILTLQGIEGKMFRPMGLTVLFALAGAMLLSFTWIPALCGLFLKVTEDKEHPLIAPLQRAYRRFLTWSLHHVVILSLAALLLIGLAGSRFFSLGSSFIPELDEGAIALHATYLPSISLKQVIERSTALEKSLMEAFPNEFKQIVSRIGRPEIATDPMLTSQSDVLIDLYPISQWTRAHNKDELVTEIAKILEETPGVSLSISQPIKMRMMELIEGVGIRADLGIKLFGDDPKVLVSKAKEISDVVSSVRGGSDVQVEVTQGLPQLRIQIDRAQLARYGINVADVNEVIEDALGGRAITQMNDANQRIDVTVKLAEKLRNDPEVIGRLQVKVPGGKALPLSLLADISSQEGPAQISRENGKRRIVIESNVRGRDLGSYVEEVQSKIKKNVELPTGYYLEYGGTYEKLQSGRARLRVVVPLTFLLVFFMLYTTFGSWKEAALVFTGIPLAISGGLMALEIRGLTMSISAAVGFIALAGIAVLNGVVMISFIRQLRETVATLEEAVIEGACTRLRPVLMTAAVASMGFFPMAISHGAGAEIQRPLATVVIGGLFTSTLLTLILLPVWFYALRRTSSPTPTQEKEEVS